MKLPVKLVRAANKVGGCLKANSPKILMGVGFVTSVAAVVDAVNQTPKAIKKLEEHKEEINKIKEYHESSNDPDYTDKDYKKDLTLAYGHTVWDMCKCYARPTAFLLTSFLSFLGAAKIWDSRNKVLSSALAASVDAAIADRKKVAEAIGEEEAARIFNGDVEKKITKEVIDEDGKPKKVKETITVANPDAYKDSYDFLWIQGDPGWECNPELRTAKIGNIQEYYNEILYHHKIVSVVSLNDIMKNFKTPKEAYKQIGQIAGWNEDSDDHMILLRHKEVSIPDPENPNVFIDAVRISPNISGSIVKDYVR